MALQPSKELEPGFRGNLAVDRVQGAEMVPADHGVAEGGQIP